MSESDPSIVIPCRLTPAINGNGFITVNNNDLTKNGDTVPNSTTNIVEMSPELINYLQITNKSKLIFLEMMAELIRYQLEFCNDYDCDKSAPKPKRVFPILKDSFKRPYMLQPSLFPLMYPTVFFTADQNNLSEVPSDLKPFLRWKITTITANTMRTIVARSGYKLIPIQQSSKNKTFNNWNAIWCKHLRVHEFKMVGYFQRINHFPGSFNFGRKDRLWINIRNKANKFGFEVYGNFHPPTFVLPNEYSLLSAYWKSNDSILNVDKSIVNNDNDKDENHAVKLFICKPPASARGQGINIVSNIEEVNTLINQQNANRDKNIRQPRVLMVVQEYISNPCLLHNNSKFDLRIYVLITSIMPLRIYVYEEGLVRFATTRYSNNIDEIKNQYIHLTNYSVNKNCVEYVPSSSIDSQDGHKWTLKTLWKYLSETRGTDIKSLWKKIIDLIIKTVLGAENNIVTLVNQHLKNPRSCFELLGFDIMIDENLKLWLLEVNITPSLRADSVLDFSVKNELVQDILNTVRYQLSPRFRRHYNFGSSMSPDKNDVLIQMAVPNLEKHSFYEKLYLENGFVNLGEILEELNDDDVFHLMESEDELIRCGKFIRIFPNVDSRNYIKYFDKCSYYNLLMVAWEEQYHHYREDGIEKLIIYMKQKEYFKKNVEILKTQLNEINRAIAATKQQQ